MDGFEIYGNWKSGVRLSKFKLGSGIGSQRTWPRKSV